MKDVLDKLLPAKARYGDIATYWKIPESQIESIENDNRGIAQKCLRAAISYWLHHNTRTIPDAPEVNWQSVIDALRDPSVDKTIVGDKIEESFRSEIRESLKKPQVEG